MTDEALEREIESALAVDPSPEFFGRVRTGIAAESPASAWRSRSLWIGVGLAAVAGLVMAVVALRGDRVDPRSIGTLQATRVSPVQLQAPSVEPAIAESLVLATRTETDALALRPPVPVARARVGPEVLIAADEGAGLHRLLQWVREGRTDVSPLLAALAGPELDSRTRIVIAPVEIPKPIEAFAAIVVEPLAAMPSVEGVRQ
jgi:hypothetical protein